MSYPTLSPARKRSPSPTERRPPTTGNLFRYGYVLLLIVAVLCSLVLEFKVELQRQLDAFFVEPEVVPDYSEFSFTMTNDKAPECGELAEGQVDFTLISQT